MTIRWALLGPGRHAARSVVPQLKTADGTALAAVMSRDRARGEAFAREHGVDKVHTTLDAVLADREIDAIYDATPDGLHAGHAIAAARAGKHVLVEKPLALSVREGMAALEASRRHGVVLGVVFNQRHEAVHHEARRLVHEGAIGEPRLAHVEIALRPAMPRPGAPAANWRTDPAMRAGGIIVSIGDHAHDTLAYLLGQSVEEVAAFSDARGDCGPNERVAGMLLRMSGGAIGHAAVSFATPFARRPFAIHGTQGSLVIANSYVYLTGADDDPAPALTVTDAAGSRTRRFSASPCFRLEIERFNRAIAGRDRPMTTAEEGLRALAVGEALYASLREGRTARVADFLPQLFP